MGYRPTPASFLPLSPTSSIYSSSSSETIANHLSARRAASRCPVRISVQRTTVVDAGRAGFTFFNDSSADMHAHLQRGRASVGRAVMGLVAAGTCSAAGEPERVVGYSRDIDPNERPPLNVDRSYMYSSQALGCGVVHSASRREPHARSLVWSGAIVLPRSKGGEVPSGAFEVSGLRVVVSSVSIYFGSLVVGGIDHAENATVQ